jgi:glycosyltransferase involved in cell wall biosynthesis
LAKRHSVLVLTPYLPQNLLNYSGSQAYDHLINFSISRYHDRFTFIKIRGHRFSQGLIPPFSLSAVSAVKSAVATFHPDVLNVHYVMPTGLAGLYAQHLLKVPVVITYNGRDVPGPGIPLFWKYWHRFIGNRCADMTFVSKYCRQVIYGALCRDGHVIYNGVDDPVSVTREQITELRTRLKLGGDAVVLFALQRLDRLKRIEVLIRSMPEIVARKPTVRLIIGGQGEDLPRLQQLAGSLKISNHVIFAGFIPPQDLPVYFTVADLFVFHSTYETFGMVLAEAMHYGKAVVSAKNTAIKEVVDDGQTGILVPSLDHRAFSEAILRLLDNHILRNRIEVNAKKKAQRYFRWDTIASAYERVLRSAAARRWL